MGFLVNYVMNFYAIYRQRQPMRPLLFSYYITHRCELACKYCCDGQGRPFWNDVVEDLNTADAKDLLCMLRRSADTLDITGGEPLLRLDLEEILAHAKKIGFRTLLNTKGIGLQSRTDILRFTDVLALSIDSLNTKVLSGIIGRSEETAQQVIEAVFHAMERCPESGTRLVLSAVATPENLKGVLEVLRFAKVHSLGFHLSPECVGKRANTQLHSSKEYKELIEAALCVKREGGKVLGIVPYLKGIRDFERFSCHPLLMPTIRPNGALYYPCLELGRADFNILDHGDYSTTLKAARTLRGDIPNCNDECHIFCHMALSLFQRHPAAALTELRHF